jgi:acyl phosphate:glycerol-3-phosphate acyltransferase
MNIYFYVGLVVLSYFLGAVPFGLIYSLLRGVDIRKVGSKNIGSTNVSRQFGFLGGFVPVFLLDFLKGALPVIAVRVFGVQAGFNIDLAMIIAGLAAMFGHMFPVYLGFKGGKGVATMAGVFVMIAPVEALLSIAVFILVFFLSRTIRFLAAKPRGKFFKDMQKNVGISSMSAAVALPIIVYQAEPDRAVILVVSIMAAILILISHRNNIKDLLKREKK